MSNSFLLEFALLVHIIISTIAAIVFGMMIFAGLTLKEALICPICMIGVGTMVSVGSMSLHITLRTNDDRIETFRAADETRVAVQTVEL